ncbi:hypothetical protein ONZ45_g16261 [Pleurotus djamor]|nr:hypothetical protein ONZ45_g16261 [Pleurotus djamor]
MDVEHRHKIKTSCFTGEYDDLVIGGTHRGCFFVFDGQSTQVIDEHIQDGNDVPVQAVAAFKVENSIIIAAASGGTVQIWEKILDRVETLIHQHPETVSTIASKAKTTRRLALLAFILGTTSQWWYPWICELYTRLLEQVL